MISWSCQVLPSGSANAARLRYERRWGRRQARALAGHGVPDLADLDAATDQLVAGGLDVVDDQQQALQRLRVIVVGALAELDRGGRARRGELHAASVRGGLEVDVEPPAESR